MRPIRVLIHAPHPGEIGGIASLYEILRPYLASFADFSYSNRARSSAGLLARLASVSANLTQFQKDMKRDCYDLILLNTPFRHRALIRESCLHFLARRAGFKTVVYFHGWDEMLAENINRRVATTFFGKTYFSASAIIVLASRFRDQLRSMGYRGPVYVVTTAVSESLLKSEGTHTTECRSRQFRILFLSRLDRSKGIDIVLRSYALLKPFYPQLHLDIAGSGDALQSSVEFVRDQRLTDVTFLGHVDGERKREALWRADVFMLPTSYPEGLPVALLEAMASGLPVLTRKVGGIPDFFRNGLMGLMTDSVAPEVYAEEIRRLIESPEQRQEIGRYNREYAMKYFLAPVVAKQLESICYRVSAATPARRADLSQESSRKGRKSLTH